MTVRRPLFNCARGRRKWTSPCLPYRGALAPAVGAAAHAAVIASGARGLARRRAGTVPVAFVHSLEFNANYTCHSLIRSNEGGWSIKVLYTTRVSLHLDHLVV